MNEIISNKPSYYSVLTADVRYDKTISDKAKLIYSELTALANTQGYAYPSNYFLAELYEVTERTIERIINELSSAKYIEIEIEKSKNGTLRKIYILDRKNVKKASKNITSDTQKSNTNPPDKNVVNPPDKNVATHPTKMTGAINTNNTSKNITSINTTIRESKVIDVSIPEPTNNTENISLSDVEKIGIKLDIKKSVFEKFYHYYSVRDFITKDNLKITYSNLKNHLLLWNGRENDNQTVIINQKPEPRINKPAWLDKYIEEVDNMEG